MKSFERSHECEVCGQEHTHRVERYTFDSSDLGLGELRINNGPVTLVVDEFADWHTEIDDGYTKIDQYWDSNVGVIAIDVVEKQEEI